MPCYYPLTAWKSADLDDINSKTGKIKMVFREDQGFPNTKTELPCGQCIGCRIDHSRMWASRIVNEASLYPWNCFLTLTYKDDSWSLNKDDMPRFMDTLREKRRRKCKAEGVPFSPIRFFQCGEYGELFARPHHHVILFNYFPQDSRYFKLSKGNKIFLSEEIAEAWPHGLHSVQSMSYDAAAYCSKYILKKINGDPAADHYQGRQPEFVTMSRRPGIGKAWYDKYKNDVYNLDKIVLDNEHIFRPPRYYDELYEGDCPDHLRELKRKRRKAAASNPDNCEDRRRTRAELAKLKEEQFKIRQLEKAMFHPPAPQGAR